MNDIIRIENMFSQIPNDLTDEIFQEIISNENFRVERIISKGQRSPDGFWYDQDQSEWVILLKGYAEIQFEGYTESIRLYPGDYLNIPAHKKHRIEKTDKDNVSVWLAIFY